MLVLVLVLVLSSKSTAAHVTLQHTSHAVRHARNVQWLGGVAKDVWSGLRRLSELDVSGANMGGSPRLYPWPQLGKLVASGTELDADDILVLEFLHGVRQLYVVCGVPCQPSQVQLGDLTRAHLPPISTLQNCGLQGYLRLSGLHRLSVVYVGHTCHIAVSPIHKLTTLLCLQGCLRQ